MLTALSDLCLAGGRFPGAVESVWISCGMTCNWFYALNRRKGKEISSWLHRNLFRFSVHLSQQKEENNVREACNLDLVGAHGTICSVQGSWKALSKVNETSYNKFRGKFFNCGCGCCKSSGIIFKQWFSGLETKITGLTFHCFLMACKTKLLAILHSKSFSKISYFPMLLIIPGKSQIVFVPEYVFVDC